MAVLTLVLVALRWRQVPPGATASATIVDALDEGGARWSRRTDGELERIELNEGNLRIKVQKAPGGRRVVVRVPDGEIEDLGTVFHVVVIEGRTKRVGVDEGRVTIRLTNETPITIASGQTWERPVEAPSIPITPTAATPIRVPSSLPAPSDRSNVHGPAPRHEPATIITSRPPPDAAEEDAAYLRAVRLLREGHDVEARAAARDYLRKFPDGFRREEVGRMAE